MKIVVAIGTRPEAIKMAPLIQQLRLRKDVQSLVCVTAQHRQMLDQALAMFDITPDIDFDLMRADQTLNQVTSRIVDAADEMLRAESPDLVLVHGDTTTAMAMSLASFHRSCAIGHVEAGLRTYNLDRPFPEEMNRRMIDIVAKYLFAPTEWSRDNLLAEKADPAKVFVTGNTVVDALKSIISRIESDPAMTVHLDSSFPFLRNGKPLVLVTGHRRESFGAGFENIYHALATLARRYDYSFVYPVHLNPNVAAPVHRILDGLQNVFLLPPINYIDFVALLGRSRFIITDSGGVQEEAVSIGKSVLVMRDVTERPEGIQAGLAHLVGTDSDRIVTTLDRLVAEYRDGALREHRVYGDGRAAQRIVEIIAGPSSRETASSDLEASYAD